MNATELFKAGKLQDAIAAQVQEVKANPADRGKRLFLFELLAFAGELDRARRQIDALHYDEPGLQDAIAAYRTLLDAEEHRRKVFNEGAAPVFLGTPSGHLQLRLEAAELLRRERPAEAKALIDRANAALPPFAGRLNGRPIASLRDSDDLFAGILEVMAQGRYLWVGLEQVVSVTANPPQFPRDLIFFPARLDLGERMGEVFLPALYPDSHAFADEQVRLGRLTEWLAAEGGPVVAVGARVFLVDDNPVGLLEWRELVRAEAPAEAPPALPEAPAS